MKPLTIHQHVLTLLCCGLSLFLSVACAATIEEELSDARKKETVYQMYAGYKEKFPAVREIPVGQAMDLLAEDAVVFVDVRKPEEMAVSMLPNAVSKQDFLDRREAFRNKTIVAYCTISYRSGLFAQKMAKQGIPVINLQGGILAWALEGGNVYDQTGNSVKRIHVYGGVWDYPPDGYDSVRFSVWKQLS